MYFCPVCPPPPGSASAPHWSKCSRNVVQWYQGTQLCDNRSEERSYHHHHQHALHVFGQWPATSPASWVVVRSSGRVVAGSASCWDRWPARSGQVKCHDSWRAEPEDLFAPGNSRAGLGLSSGQVSPRRPAWDSRQGRWVCDALPALLKPLFRTCPLTPAPRRGAGIQRVVVYPDYN